MSQQCLGTTYPVSNRSWKGTLLLFTNASNLRKKPARQVRNDSWFLFCTASGALLKLPEDTAERQRRV